MPPVIDLTRCQRSGKHPTCLICSTYCPGDVIKIDTQKKTPVVLYADECCHCGNCRMTCPKKAIAISLPLGMLV
jgi:NAD-dependent dihydropyrimidine dehydrogenase PreA subunit